MSLSNNLALLPLVSIIIPAYNAAHFLAETINSVLSQTYQNFELLIVDDGSTDDTAAVVKGFGDERIRYWHKKNSGVSDTRNFGISKAKGAYIAFLDADDLFLPQNLEKKILFLENNQEIDLVHSAEVRFDSSIGSEIALMEGSGGEVLEKLLSMSGNVIHSPSSVLVRKKLLEKTGGFDPRLSTSADWDMWVRFAKETSFGYIPEPLVKYRVHAAQMHNNIRLMDRDMHLAMNKHFKEGLFSSVKHYYYCLAKMRLVLSACYLGDERNLSKSVKLFLLSVKNNPKPAFHYLLTKLRLR